VRGETKALGLVDSNENCWSTFISRVRQNLHMVFTASPVGEAFRVRSQRFLATVTSTVIDWFQPWPEASLHSVARKFLDGTDLGDDATRCVGRGRGGGGGGGRTARELPARPGA
jgi:dynein heavy chain